MPTYANIITIPKEGHEKTDGKSQCTWTKPWGLSEQVREHAKKSIVDHLNLEKKKIHHDLS